MHDAIYFLYSLKIAAAAEEIANYACLNLNYAILLFLCATLHNYITSQCNIEFLHAIYWCRMHWIKSSITYKKKLRAILLFRLQFLSLYVALFFNYLRIKFELKYCKIINKKRCLARSFPIHRNMASDFWISIKNKHSDQIIFGWVNFPELANKELVSTILLKF